MDTTLLLRLVILGVGWPILIAGSVRMGLQARGFYRRVGATSFGRLIVTLVAGLLVTMYSLGVTATAFMWISPGQGVPIVIPIFAGWFLLMLFVAGSLGRWTNEVEHVSSFYARLDEANRARVDLVNRASHELSTPLTPLLIQSQMLREADLGPLTPQQATAAKIIHRNLERLASLVREMMDVARLQAGNLNLSRTRVDLSDVLDETYEAYAPAAREAGVRFERRIEHGLDVEADPVRLVQIVQNLVSNGIRFTPRNGSVQLVARREGERACVTVADTGVGFESKDASKLFEPFAQLSHPRPKKAGVGLGLYIARSLVDAHGGTIWAQSDGPGRGSTFGFELLLAPEQARANASPSVARNAAPAGH